MAQVFGSATVLALDQSGVQRATPAFSASSACFIQASFFDNTDAAMVPQSLSYRIDDVASGAQVLGWTTLTALSVVTVEITAAQNALISQSRESECHEVTVRLTDPSGNGPFYADTRFELLRSAGVNA